MANGSSFLLSINSKGLKYEWGGEGGGGGFKLTPTRRNYYSQKVQLY